MLGKENNRNKRRYFLLGIQFRLFVLFFSSVARKWLGKMGQTEQLARVLRLPWEPKVIDYSFSFWNKEKRRFNKQLNRVWISFNFCSAKYIAHVWEEGICHTILVFYLLGGNDVFWCPHRGKWSRLICLCRTIFTFYLSNSNKMELTPSRLPYAHYLRGGLNWLEEAGTWGKMETKPQNG